jgi:phosphoketolase
MAHLFRQFSFPGGVPSHAAPETPGSIKEGGEFGYSLMPPDQHPRGLRDADFDALFTTDRIPGWTAQRRTSSRCGATTRSSTVATPISTALICPRF